MAISMRQLRAACALLNWSFDDLAAASGVAKSTLATLETQSQQLASGDLHAVCGAIEAAGVLLLSEGDVAAGEGACIRSPNGMGVATVDQEMLQYPEFLSGDGGPGSGG